MLSHRIYCAAAAVSPSVGHRCDSRDPAYRIKKKQEKHVIAKIQSSKKAMKMIKPNIFEFFVFQQPHLAC